MTVENRMFSSRLHGRIHAVSLDRLCESTPQVMGRCVATLFAPTAVGDTEGGIGAILLALSSLKHLKCLQTYTYFQAQTEL